jgi:putative ABC transport system permease protein
VSGYRRYFRLRPGTAAERRDELSDEIEGHVAMRAADLVRQGRSAAQARAEAEARFGDRDQVFLSARERDDMLRRREGLTAVARDMRLALRQARRTPGATLLTVLTFALGIGLTTAIFSLVYGVLLRPLPYPEPDRLVLVQGMDSAGTPITRVSYPNWLDLAEQNTTLESTALHQGTRLAVNSHAATYRVATQLVTTQFFDVLRTPLLFGRGFSSDDVAPGTGTVVISETLWRRELGARAESGLTLRIEGAPHSVIGVVADEQAYPAGTHLWLPKRAQRRVGGFFRNYINDEAIARLRPGVTAAEAEAELGALARQVQAAEPESDYMHGAPLLPLRDHVVGESGRYLTLLMSAVAIVLLLACANLAALNLARARFRTNEVALRYALGAGRLAVIRQLLTEQLTLALAGGAIGVLLAWVCTRLVVVAAAGQLPRVQEVRLDPGVLLFAVVVTVLAGALAGLAPAWTASATSARSLVGGRTVAAGGRGVPGAALVVAEMAIAVLLLIGAGLLVRSFQSVLSRDTGFAVEGVAAADILLTGERYSGSPQRMQQWQAILAGIGADQAIAAAAVANWIPTGRSGTGYLVVDGRDEDPDGTGYYVVSEDYFAAMDIPILLGRSFDERDARDGGRVALVNRTMAERYWPGGNAIGQRFRVPGMEGPRENAPLITVIGVVGDVRHHGYEDERSRNQTYVLYRQVPDWEVAMTVIARHAGGNAAAAGVVMRREVRALDPSLAVEPETIEQRLGTLIAERRLVVSVLGAFGALALLLAVIGVYGMLSFAVAQRTQEIGIRAALGADRSRIARLIMLSATRVVLAGVAIGLVLAYWLTRVIESMLVDVTRTDPLAWAGAVALLAVIAYAAAALPARRAARVDPLISIRSTP